MKTEYRIIWVDDEIDSVDTDISDTTDFLESYGIAAQILPFEAKEDQNIHDEIKPELLNPDLDLIIIDYKMDGIDGGDLIDMIRETDHVFLPVIFYSNASADELHEEARKAKLDGVYIAHRDQLKNKIEQVIRSLLFKEQSSKRTRGLLMEGVSEIDANFGALFPKLWERQGDDLKAKMIAYLCEKLEERKKGIEDLLAEIPDDASEFETFMEGNFFGSKFDTITRWKIIKKQYALLKQKSDGIDTFHRLFDKKGDQTPLIVLRNNYGHRTRAQLDKNHSEKICISIRKELRVQLENLDQLIREDDA